MSVALETPHFQAYRGEGTPRFVNEAELEYAKILDYYGVPGCTSRTPSCSPATRGPRDRGVHARLLPARPGSLPRGDGDEAVARHPQEPQAAQAARALPGRAGSSSSTSATSRGIARGTACARLRERASSTSASARSISRRGEIAGPRARARRRARPRLRGPRAAPRRRAEGVHPVRHRPLARGADRARARLRRARRLRLGGARRPRADPLPQGPRPRDRAAAT